MSSVSNDFMQNTLLSIVLIVGISCFVRVCCLCLRRHRFEQEIQT